jgi:hypothetical protein
MVSYLLLHEKASKVNNDSKFAKEQEIFANWTIDGGHHQLNKN